ncbi:tetratricopeptide repeat protein [Thioalkalivibrio sp. ALE21]|uniref:tetratricopeptide repeat protein n=1 Tax=Thioalkalivibrio sp. ALE21 TaxID=1158175 RepID=UPI000D8C4923|nr:tetratricopeptide repeat protein [Thioalkalivibrio sp. ALE21]PYG03167.1 tetratricopeptide repeat protein [Thioalkalivibrio sp. ALE21]
MTRTLLAAAVALLVSGCAHHSLGAGEPLETDAPEIVTLPESGLQEDPEAALMFSVLAGEIAVRSGQTADAAAFYGAAAALSHDPEIAERATRIALFARDREQALRSGERWLALSPEHMEAVQIVALLRIDAGQVEAAAQQLDELMQRRAGEGASPYSSLVSLMVQADNRDHALETLDHLATRRAGDRDTWRVYAELALRFDATGAALQATERGLEQHPDAISLYLLRVQALERDERGDEALALMREAVAAHPDSRDARIGYAHALTDHADDDRGPEEIARLAELAPDDHEARLTLALLSLESGWHEAAREQLEALEARGVRENEVAYYLGRLHELEGDADRARTFFERVGEGEFRADARLRLAALTLRENGAGAARAAFDELQTHDDADVAREAWVVEVNTLREEEAYERALERADAALDAFPEESDLLYLRGLIHERLDRVDAALQDFRTILDNDPDSATAMNALGYTLADRTDRYEEAYELITQALEQRPDDAAVVDSYGWVLYKLGRLDEAEEQLRRAWSMMEDGEIASNLAVVLWEQGERDEARELLDKALEREPGHERLQRVRRELLE